MIKASQTIYTILQGLLIIYLIYCLLFVIQHFVTPSIGEVNIVVSPNSKISNLQDITVISKETPSKYYVLIYEENQKSDWIYHVHQTYEKERQIITDTFLPKDTMKYILIEGNKKKSSFTFQIQPKYPINYVARKQSCFHTIYIVPYKIYPFPEFYYCTHSILYIEALN